MAMLGMDADLDSKVAQQVKDLINGPNGINAKTINDFIKPDNQIWIAIGLNNTDFQSATTRKEIAHIVFKHAGTDTEKSGRDQLAKIIGELLKQQDERINGATIKKKSDDLFDKIAVELFTSRNDLLVKQAQDLFLQKETQAAKGQTEKARESGQLANNMVAELAQGAKRLAAIEDGTSGRANQISAELLESLRTGSNGQQLSREVQADILRAATVSGFSASVVFAKAEEWHVLTTPEQSKNTLQTTQPLTESIIAREVRERIGLLYADLEQYYNKPDEQQQYDKRRAELSALIGERRTKSAERQIGRHERAKAFGDKALLDELQASAALRQGKYGEIVPRKIMSA